MFAFTLLVASLWVGSASAESPQVHYMLHCQGCHGAEGREVPGKIPGLGEMGSFLTVPGGRAYLVQVPGTAQAPLRDAEIAALLNWMLPRFSPDRVPADFEPYTTEEVAGYRRQPLTDVGRIRRELVEAIGRLR